MTTIAVENRSSQQRTLAWVIATFAIAGGLIHLEASIDHRDRIVIAIGFAAMAITQLAVAGLIFIRPSPTVVFGMGALHTGIALVWIMSRTIGLAFIPGAEHPARVGVSDVVANTFSIAVVAFTIVALSLDRSDQALTRTATPRTIRLVASVGALILTVAAISVPHDHADHPGVSVAAPTTHSHDR